MMPAETPSPESDDRIDLLLEGSLGDEERAALLAELKSDPGKLHDFRQHLEISEALSRRHTRRSDENFILSTTAHVFSIAEERNSEFVGNVVRRAVRRTWTRRLAIAAMLTLSAAGIFLVQRHAGKDPLVATMTHLNDNGEVIGTSDIPAGFKHSPVDGLFRLNFTNGAVVAIEGPADFQIESPFRMRLDSGRLNAWCPETAHGFQVATRDGTVTDLGTSFGVSATKDGPSDFIVLDGLIKVTSGRFSRQLDEGKAVRTDPEKGFNNVRFEPSPYHRTWPLASGILATSGEVKPAPPGTAEQLSKLEDNTSVFVIPEKRNVSFEEPILAEIVAPGSFPSPDPKQIHTLQPDPKKRLRAFLVRYNPKYSNNFRNFTGEVTFDRPVLAICCQGKYLDATDSTFANGNYEDVSEEARKFRGIDIDQPQKYPDKVTLSEDRRTVGIHFSAGVSTDDIRVILAEE